MIKQSKSLHEKEFLDYIRLTYTDISKNFAQSKGVKEAWYEFNTLTLSPALLNDSSKFFNLIFSIAGNNFLKIPYEQYFQSVSDINHVNSFEYLIEEQSLSCQFPIWLCLEKSNSLCQWIIFFFELSLWAHYTTYITNNIQQQQQQYQQQQQQQENINNLPLKFIYLKSQNQIIDPKNQLYNMWQDLQKNNLTINQKSSYEIISDIISKLNQDCMTSVVQISQQSCMLFVALLLGNLNQDPSIFIQGLCLTQLSKLNTDLFTIERLFIKLLMEQIGMSPVAQKCKILKNQKKKNKRKLKKIEAKNIKEQIIQQQIQKSDSNQAAHESIIQKISQDLNANPINNNTKDIINNSLRDLVAQFENQEEESKKMTQHVESKAEVTSVQEKDYQIQFDDVVSESNFFQLLEMNSDLKGSDENQTGEGDRMRKQISAFSESTEDIMEHFSSANFHDLKSPQASTSSKIELNLKKKNLYSSDAGDSSMQFQNQFSDYNLRDLSNKNEIFLSSVKKNSIDSIDMQFSFNQDQSKQEDSLKQQQQQNQSIHNQIKIKDNLNKNNQLLPLQQSQNQQIEQDQTTTKQIEIIRSSKKFIQEQQSAVMNKNRKKKKKRGGNGNGNNGVTRGGATQKMFRGNYQQQSDCSNKMNEFMRNIIQQEDEEEYYDQEYVYQKRDGMKEQQKTSSQLIQTQYAKKTSSKNSKTGNYDICGSQQIDQLQQKYVLKGSSMNLHQSQLEEIKEQDQNSLQFQSIESQSDQQSINLLSRFDSFINQQDRDNSNTDDFSKKKKTNKGKKQGWDSKNKKKSGKNNRNTQPQFAKQNSYNQTIASPLALTLGRQMSQFDMVYDSQTQSLPQFSLDINMIKQALQQEVIQQSILNAQKQNVYLQQNLNSQQDINDEYFEQQDLIIQEYFEMLNGQMESFQKQIEKKLDSVLKEREQAIKIICGLVEQYYKDRPFNVKVKTYGSMASNLAIDTSDVDLAVVGLNFQGNREEQIREMRNICQQIDFMIQSKSSLKFIETATVPVIKLQIDLLKLSQQIERQEKNVYGYSIPLKNRIDESMRYLGIDITFEDNVKSQNYNIEGISRISLGLDCINYIKEKCMKQPGLKPIVLILKRLLQNYNLNQTYSGGLNSYSLVLMTSAFLNQFEGVQYVSMNLMEFFNYYGNYFDPKTTIITNESVPSFVKSEIMLDDNILIVDPLNELNNTARGAFQINKIKDIFREAHKFIGQCLDQFKLDQQKVEVIQLLLNNQKDNQSFHQF